MKGRLENLLTDVFCYSLSLDVPPGTRIDPSAFPEDEYPVYCDNCHYLLRGLADQRCPECGERFDRGLLLVQQYADGRSPHRRVPMSTQARVLAWAVISPVAALLAIGTYDALTERSLSSRLFTAGAHSLANITLLVLAFAAVGGFIVLSITKLSDAARADRQKMRQVRRAVLQKLFAPARPASSIIHVFPPAPTNKVLGRVFCPAFDADLDETTCWECSMAGRGGPTDTAEQLRRWIAETDRFGAVSQFQKVCETCPNRPW